MRFHLSRLIARTRRREGTGQSLDAFDGAPRRAAVEGKRPSRTRAAGQVVSSNLRMLLASPWRSAVCGRTGRVTPLFPSSRERRFVRAASFFPPAPERGERERARFSRHEEKRGSRPRTPAVARRRRLSSVRPSYWSAGGRRRRVGGSRTPGAGPARPTLPLARAVGARRRPAEKRARSSNSLTCFRFRRGLFCGFFRQNTPRRRGVCRARSPIQPDVNGNACTDTFFLYKYISLSLSVRGSYNRHPPVGPVS